VIYLLAFGVIAALLVWLGRGRAAPGARTRLATAAFSALAMVGAGVSAVRGLWPVTAGLSILSAWLWTRARRRAALAAQGPEDMSLRQARALLGVAPGASPEEIQSAYLRLIRTVHPDRGGTAGLASEINAARDRLLRGG
jgi:hypothetical protein